METSSNDEFFATITVTITLEIISLSNTECVTHHHYYCLDLYFLSGSKYDWTSRRKDVTVVPFV